MKKLILLNFLLMPAALFAQTYAVDWHKIAGGGGTSSGGNYSLTGTIGQLDAGKMTGGNYTLEGGFLSGIVLIQTTGAPVISIQLSSPNAILSWAEAGSSGFILQEASSLAVPVSWANSGATVNTSGGTKSVTISAMDVKFYRLYKP